MTDQEAKRRAIEINNAIVVRMANRSGLSTRNRVLEVARYLVGEQITETSGRNDGVPNHLFCDGYGEHNEKPPWCAAFVAYVFNVAGAPLPGKRMALWSCTEMRRQLAMARREIAALDDPDVGDIVFYWGRRDSDPIDRRGVHHCGIVAAIDGSKITTIEGNVSNRLGWRTINQRDPAIACYARAVD